MTPQEIFNTVATHLFTQGRRAYVNPALAARDRPGVTAGCLYRAPDGTRCAVGAILPDDYYLPAMEGKALENLDLTCLPEWMQQNDELLMRLQDAHDDLGHWESDSVMKRVLFGIARDFDLHHNVLDDLTFRRVPRYENA